MKKWICTLVGVLLTFNCTIVSNAEALGQDYEEQSYNIDICNEDIAEQSEMILEQSEITTSESNPGNTIEICNGEDGSSLEECISFSDVLSNENQGIWSDGEDAEKLQKSSEDKNAVVLTAPSDFKVVQTTINSVRMSWTPVENAEYYELYRDINNSGSWRKVKNIYGTLGSNLNLESNSFYSYKIRAVGTDNGIKVYGLYSLPVSITISAGKTEGLIVERNSISTVRLKWNTVKILIF